MESLNQITLRDATKADDNLVYTIKRAALSHYVEKQYGVWDEDEQQHYHRLGFTPENIKIILLDCDVVGYFSVNKDTNYIKVNQLMIQPNQQGQGIGAYCIDLIKFEARRIKCPIVLQVLKVNLRAMKFYLRNGFIVTGETDTHYQMEAC